MILVDSGPLVALCDDRDRLHRRAMRELRSLGREERAVAIPVLVEAHVLLQAGYLRARLRELLATGTVQAREPADASGCLRYCLQWLETYEQHSPDFTDGYLVAMAHQSGAEVWTFDGEFESTWRLLEGGAVHRAAASRAGPRRR